MAQSRLAEKAAWTRDKPIAPSSPWQNGFAERLIGSIRRECLDHFVIWGEAHLRRVLGILRTLLQHHQNAPIISQRCADLSPSSADRIIRFIRGSWWASSSLFADLSFRYGQDIRNF